MADFDVIVIGAGHNGLILAGYLARAGYRVGVFERRPIVGGAVSTEELFPGYQIDLGGSAHTLIRLTPIVDELELEQFGLRYIDLDPIFFAPFEDGEALFFYRDVERTAEGLERHMTGEGEAYRRFIDDWKPFAETVKDVFLSVPSPFEIGKRMVKGSGPRLGWRDALRTIMRPYGDVVNDYFRSEKLKAALVWMAAQSGPPPTEPMTAPFLLWHPLYHEAGIARPEGGSGMLTVALERHLRSFGGEVFVDAPVSRILMEGGRAVGVELGVAGGGAERAHGGGDERGRRGGDERGADFGRPSRARYTARAVVSAAHAYETFGKLLPEDFRPPAADSLRIGNGFGAVVRAALNAPVEYAAHPGKDARIGLQLLCRDRNHISAAYGDFLAGRPASDPPIVAMTFSAVDPSLAPPGGEVLWLWAQYFPYELASGHWDDIGGEVAESIFSAFERYAPGTREKVVDFLFEHPLYLERELGLYRGNVMHLEMGLDQMFCMRPLPNMSRYRAHVDGLYLTGASTHPGGGIMGASGRNAARVLLRDLDRGKV